MLNKIMKSVSIALFISIIGIFLWLNNTHSLSTDISLPIYDNVDISTAADGTIIFQPNDNPTNTGLIVYPGALVEPEAYTYYASAIASHGYLVALLSVNMHLSLFDTNKAAEVMAQFPDMHWYVAGHSMGGVSAASFAKDHHDQLAGLILLASYPDPRDNLSNVDIPVISIYADLDGLTTLENIADSRPYLPDDTIFKKIAGGNHAQFGLYGSQTGDLDSTISPIAQQDQIIAATLEFIANTN